ncbi:amino acid adenylation domain-containing protein (plasmid) [Scytonema sp. HK-05]|uniref:non-ribosomal peptide synthetase n=1 Tax=Scytonema sp. HK-05 TaxID=1137095 RepID=UPI00093742F8|nr:non-ribosomal peptide synthetase [Scytonema sp. HK-05]OKH59457.1 non-ribosomal peptide synthetase [Scytonema sp. HK-05]BAY50143.1 amino acid adenylation domain-containing protein [Scytonema sp. HK-05]
MKKNNIEDIYQLSPMQQGMLFHTLYAPDYGVYCQQFNCTFTGKLDVEAFTAAWQQVVARHVVLRTAFVWERQDQPLQVVSRQVKLPIEIHSWIGLSPQEQQQQLQAFLESDQNRGFQLTKAPLMRLTLIQMSDDVYQFVWSYHHILLDGWSLPLVFKEVLLFYEAKSLGQQLQLPPTRSYREYVAWLQKQNLAQAEEFWRQTLFGVTAPTPLVIDKAHHSKSLQQSYSEKILLLSSEATTALVSFARKYQLTLNTLVQAAWASLLLRYSGETDVVFGVTVSGRTAPIISVESIVGLFINTLPMRVGVTDEDTVLPWLKQIHKQQVEITSYEYTPLVQIQRLSDVPQGLPLFESIVVFENYPVDSALEQNSQKLHISDVRAFERNNYPLTLIAQPGVQLSFRFIYDSQRFESASVTRMVGHFQALLQGLVADPDQKLSHIPLLSATEQHQILIEWNNTHAPYPQEKCLHSLFEQQVQKTPDAVAVVFEEQRLTYSELNTRANQLAHYLQALGVGPEVLVGVCLERSVEMVVGLLGILKAGGAYVPVDPEYPQERLAYMLEDSRVKVLLTQEKLVARLAEQQAHLVCLDTNWQAISESSAENPRSGVLPHHLAYVIYTSGSTGKPKGAMNTHQAICNRLVWMQQAYQITPDDCILQKTPFSFDVSVWEFFWPLMTGARLVVAQPGGHRDSAYLVKLIAKEQITTLHFVPSMLQVFLEEQSLESCTSLRQVFCSGEALPKELQEKFFARLGCSLHNLYGPTEAAIDVTYWQCHKDSILLSVPIGRAIANTQIYILDPHLQPVPTGVPGELHIGGVGLARGYLNRPETTAEKFIPNPFSSEPGSRLYKTGDLARYLNDGNIEYICRIDFQVKIRGFRIELGEIEAVLTQHPDVNSCVTIVREDATGDKRLVAYVVADTRTAVTMSQLRSFLKQKLPDYMVPSAFVILDSLPLTPNGKLDRRALPKPDTTRHERETVLAPPRTESEEILAKIWREVLHLEQVSIHDNFFELGGDSILSIQIIFKAKQAGLQLTAKQIFEHLTIAELAAAANATQTAEAEQGHLSGLLPLTPIQHWFFEQNLPEPHHFNQSFLLEVPQTFDPALLSQVVQQLLVHHDALRLRFVQSGSHWEQINAIPDDTIPFSHVNLSTIPDAEQKAAIEAAAASLQASLNLSSGPLMRVAFFALGTDKPSRLLIVIHHLAVDGVSWRILLDDLLSAYQQLSRGEAIVLPPKTTSFKHWAMQLTSYARSDTAKKELTYWQGISRTDISRLPVDNAFDANTVASARTVSVSLSPGETRALLQEVPKAYKTQINDILLTALVQVLGKWTGNNSVLLNLEGHGREDIFEDVDLSRTVGWFTTIFPVLLELKATDNVGESLKSIKEQLRAVPNRGIGYGLLRYLSGDAEITSTLQALPQAEVSFNYLGQFDWGMQENSLFKLAPESVGSQHSQLGSRSHLLDINGFVVESQLQLDWTYSENFHKRATIESLAQDFAASLRSLIAHCLSADAGGDTSNVSETIHSFPQPINNYQRQENNASIPLHLLELPEEISELLPSDIESAYPLAKMQEFMLHHYANDHQKMGVYHFQQSYDIYDDNLSLNAFKKSLEISVQKHPALRTVFITQNGKPVVQVVKKNLRFSINEHDISNMKADEQESYVNEVVKQDRQNLFNVENSNEPLFRFNIFCKAKNRFEFFMSTHHAIIDGWSNIEFLNQLYEFYLALKKREEITLSPAANVYKEFVALEKEILGSQDASNFWKFHLKNYTYKPFKPLTTPVAQVEAVAQEYNFDSEIIADLREFCRKLKVSPKALFLSTYLDLIGTVMKENMVSVGIISNSRTERLSDPFGALGLFWNIVPFCQQVIKDKEVQIQNVQQSLIDIEPYVRYPLLEILSDQQLKPGAGAELFCATFNFMSFHNAKELFEQTDLKVNARRSHDKFNFPLNFAVSMKPSSEDVSIRVEYDQMYFSCLEIRSMVQNYVEILYAVHRL